MLIAQQAYSSRIEVSLLCNAKRKQLRLLNCIGRLNREKVILASLYYGSLSMISFIYVLLIYERLLYKILDLRKKNLCTFF